MNKSPDLPQSEPIQNGLSSRVRADGTSLDHQQLPPADIAGPAHPTTWCDQNRAAIMGYVGAAARWYRSREAERGTDPVDGCARAELDGEFEVGRGWIRSRIPHAVQPLDPVLAA